MSLDPKPWFGGPSGRAIGWPPDSELGRAMMNAGWIYSPRPDSVVISMERAS